MRVDRWQLQKYGRTLVVGGWLMILVYEVLERAHQNALESIRRHTDHHPDHDGPETFGPDNDEDGGDE
jgi:hypothetical protein